MGNAWWEIQQIVLDSYLPAIECTAVCVVFSDRPDEHAPDCQ